MPTTLGEAVVNITGNLSGLHESLDEAHGQVQGLGGKLAGALGGAVKVGLGAAVVGAGALVAGLGACVSAAAEAQQIEAQLDAALLSTGGAAGMTKDALMGLANSLSLVTPVEDEAIIAGEAMLLTFTNIGKDVFPDATQALLDMATAMNSGAAPGADQLKSSAIQLGKALNDPVQGMSALRRVGVAFSDAQEEVIKKMVESGDVMGAQKLMLAELKTEFGGSAVAAGQTFAGSLTILKNSMGNVMETIGGALLPALTSVAQGISKALADPAIQAAISNLASGLAAGIGGIISWITANLPTIIGIFQNVFSVIGTIISGVAGFISPFVSAIQGIISIIQQVVAESSGLGVFTANLQAMTGINIQPLTSALAILQGLITGITTGNFTQLINAFYELTGIDISPLIATFQGLISTIQTSLPPIIATVQGVVSSILSLFSSLVASVLPIFAGLFQSIIAFISSNLPTIVSLFQTMGGAIKTVFDLLRTTVLPALVPVIQGIVSVVQTSLPTISAIFKSVASIITQVIGVLTSTVLPLLANALAGILGWVKDRWPTISQVIKAVLDTVAKVLQWVANDVLPVLLSAFKAAVAWLVEHWPQIQATVTTVLEMAGKVMKDMVEKNILPLVEGFKKVVAWIEENWPKIKETITTAMDKIKDAFDKWQKISDDTQKALQDISDKITKVLNDAGKTVETFKTDMETKWGEIRKAITDKIDEAKKAIEQWITDVKTALTGIDLFQIGADIIQGLINGINSKIADAKALIQSLFGLLNTTAQHESGTEHSPSSIYEAIGLDMMAGLALGVEAGESGVMEALINALGNINAEAAKKVSEIASSIKSLLESVRDIAVALSAELPAPVIGFGPFLDVLNALRPFMDQVLGILGSVSEDTQKALDKAKAWAEGAGGIISAIAGAVDSLNSLAVATVPDAASLRRNLQDLFISLQTSAGSVLAWLFSPEFRGWTAADEKVKAWLEGASGVVGAIAGAIENLASIAKATIPDSKSLTRNLQDIFIQLQTAAGQVLSWLSAPEFKGWVAADDKVKTWAENAVSLISTLAGAISSLQSIAAYIRPDLTALATNVKALAKDLKETGAILLMQLTGLVPDWTEADERAKAWAEGASGLLSTLAGAIGNLQTIAAYVRPDLVALGNNVLALAEDIKTFGSYAVNSFRDAVPEWTEAEDAAKAWVEGATGLLGALAGAIANLLSLSEYIAPDLMTLYNNVKQLAMTVHWLGDELILYLTPAALDWTTANTAARAWVEGAGGLLNALGSSVASMKTLAEYIAPDLMTLYTNVTQLMMTIHWLGDEVLRLLGEQDWTTANTAAKTWAENATGLLSAISQAISGLQTIAAYVRPDAARLTVSLQALSEDILTLGRQVVTYFTESKEAWTIANGKAKEWVESATGLLSAIAGAIGSIGAIATYVRPDTIVLKTNLSALCADVLQVGKDAVAYFTNAVVEWSEANGKAKAWVENATGLLSTITGAIANIAAVAAYVRPSVATLTTNLTALLEDIKSMGDAIVLALKGKEWLDADKAAKDWADGATGVLSSVAGAITSILAIADWKGVKADVAALAKSLTELLVGVAKAIVKAITDAKVKWDIGEKAAQDWATSAGGILNSIAGAIKGLQDVAGWTTLKANVGVLATKITEVLVSVAKAILDAIALAGAKWGDSDIAAKAWADGAGGMLSTIAGAIKGLQDLAAFPGLQGNLAGLAMSIVYYLNAVAEAVVKAIGESSVKWDAAADAAKAWLDKAVGLLEPLAASTQSWKTIIEGEMDPAHVKYISESLVKAIIGTAKIIIDTIGNGGAVWDTAAEAAKSWLEKASSLFSLIATAVQGWSTEKGFDSAVIKASFKVITDIMSDFVTAAKGYGPEGLAAAQQLARTLLDMAGALDTGFKTLLGIIQGGPLPTAIRSILTQVATEIYDGGKAIGGQFIAGLIAGFTPNMEALNTAIGNVKAALNLGSYYASGFSIGSDLVGGIIDGINARIAELVAALAALAALLPHSPAERGPLSEPVEWGFLAQGLPGVLSDMRNKLEGGLAVAMPGLPALGAATAPVLAPALAGAGGQEVHLHFEGNIYGTDREAADKMFEYLAGRIRREGVFNKG